jgi:hypothetical protein
VLQNVQDVKTKVSDSIFENYKLQVAQTNDINNRAMQVALQKSTALADLKQATSAGTLQTMLAATRTDAAIGQTAAATIRAVMEQGEATRGLVNGLNTQNLNTALINTNIGLSGLNTQYGGLGLAYGGACSAVQNVQTNSAVNALNSSLSNQRFVNTGNVANTTQTSTPTNIG